MQKMLYLCTRYTILVSMRIGNMLLDYIQQDKIREFLRFGIVGTLATGIHYGIYALLLMLDNSLVWSNVAYSIGYILSFVANFYLTAYFTFRTTPSWKKLGGMVGAHIVNYAMHMLLLNLFLFVGVPDKWAPIPVFCIVIPVNFILVRFVFKDHKR